MSGIDFLGIFILRKKKCFIISKKDYILYRFLFLCKNDIINYSKQRKEI